MKSFFCGGFLHSLARSRIWQYRTLIGPYDNRGGNWTPPAQLSAAKGPASCESESAWSLEEGRPGGAGRIQKSPRGSQCNRSGAEAAPRIFSRALLYTGAASLKITDVTRAAPLHRDGQGWGSPGALVRQFDTPLSPRPDAVGVSSCWLVCRSVVLQICKEKGLARVPGVGLWCVCRERERKGV